MSGKSTFILAFRLLMVIIASMLPGAPTALAREVVTGTLSAVRVSVGGSWSYNDPASSNDGNVDTMVFTHRSGNFVVSGGSRDVDHMLAALPPGSRTTNIDVSATYALRSVSHNGSIYGVVSVVVGDHVHSVIAPTGAFDITLGDARASIFVDGAAVFFGVDEGALADLLPGGEGADRPLIGDEERTADLEPPESATAKVTDRLSAQPQTVNGDDAVRLRGGDYVAPWSGVRISWTDEWQVGVDNGKLRTSSSLEGYQYDQICLESSRQTEGIGICLFVTRFSGSDNAEGWQERYAAPDASSVFGTPYYAVRVADSSVTYADIDVQGEVASISQADVMDGLRITASVFGPPEQLTELVRRSTASVEVNGEPILDRVDVEQLRVETAVMMASLPAYRDERNAGMEALGLVDGNHFKSASLECDVVWTAPLELQGMGTLSPIDQGASLFFNDVEVPTEEFHLYDTQNEVRGRVTCVQDVSTINSWVLWSEAQWGAVSTDWSGNAYPEYLAVEGADIYYVVDRALFDQPQIYVLIRPLGGPTVLFSFSIPDGGLDDYLTTVRPGMLIINGVDVFQAMKDDGITSQVP